MVSTKTRRSVYKVCVIGVGSQRWVAEGRQSFPTPQGVFFFCTLIVRLIGLVVNGKCRILCHVILGKTEKLRQIFGHISQRQHRICGYAPHCRPTVFNLNINRKRQPSAGISASGGLWFYTLGC